MPANSRRSYLTEAILTNCKTEVFSGSSWAHGTLTFHDSQESQPRVVLVHTTIIASKQLQHTALGSHCHVIRIRALADLCDWIMIIYKDLKSEFIHFKHNCLIVANQEAFLTFSFPSSRGKIKSGMTGCNYNPITREAEAGELSLV